MKANRHHAAPVVAHSQLLQSDLFALAGVARHRCACPAAAALREPVERALAGAARRW